MSPVSNTELDREYEVLGQTLAIHAYLRDRCAFISRSLDVVLLVCAVVFCATTFADDDVFVRVGLSPRSVRDILGVASIAAFLVAELALLLNWRGKAAQHEEAVQSLSRVVALFRKYWDDESRTRPQARRSELHKVYNDSMSASIRIPSGKFLGLKARYRRTVEVSKLASEHPGCPVLLLRLVVLWRSAKSVLSRGASSEEETPGEREPDCQETEQSDQGVP